MFFNKLSATIVLPGAFQQLVLSSCPRSRASHSSLWNLREQSRKKFYSHKFPGQDYSIRLQIGFTGESLAWYAMHTTLLYSSLSPRIYVRTSSKGKRQRKIAKNLQKNLQRKSLWSKRNLSKNLRRKRHSMVFTGWYSVLSETVITG